MEQISFILEGVAFEDLVAQSATAPTDIEARDVLSAHIKEIVADGDIERIMAMAAMVGATACFHPHLAPMADLLGELMTTEHDDTCHAHEPASTGHAQGFTRPCLSREEVSDWYGILQRLAALLHFAIVGTVWLKTADIDHNVPRSV
jgi:hypothetical protein